MRKIFTILASALIVCCGGSEPARYTVQGEGPVALILIHDRSCDSGHWSSLVDHFSRDHAVVTLDRQVAGAAEVRRVIHDLALKRVVLVGHSMGGPLALETAELVPDRVLGIVGVDVRHDSAPAGHRGYDALIMDGADPAELNRRLAEALEELTGAH